MLISLVFKNGQLDKLPASNNFSSMAIGFTTIQSSLKIFGAERIVFWREVSGGASRNGACLRRLCTAARICLPMHGVPYTAPVPTANGWPVR